MRLNEIDSIEHQKVEHCKLILQSRVELFRGVKYNKGWDFISDIRSDRKPKTSTTFEVEIFDKLCEANGWPHRKSNTLSVTSYSPQAKTYGDFRYKIYPFDGTSYLYSTDDLLYSDFLSIPYTIVRMYIDDVFAEELAKHDSMNYDWYRGKVKKEIAESSAMKKEFFKWIHANAGLLSTKMSLKTTTNPIDLKQTNGEILLHGAQYIGVMFDQR